MEVWAMETALVVYGIRSKSEACPYRDHQGKRSGKVLGIFKQLSSRTLQRTNTLKKYGLFLALAKLTGKGNPSYTDYLRYSWLDRKRNEAYLQDVTERLSSKIKGRSFENCKDCQTPYH